jgi:hypothetical protein
MAARCVEENEREFTKGERIEQESGIDLGKDSQMDEWIIVCSSSILMDSEW